ncbi:GNAT family N-acetyltransferase [Sphingomonas phyllosphaerae]|uniref:GNAT family N-acetyltransferase n=1 Tax=Sphingomonas phyllosphaerae TaxID=257003 RepID=UPI0024136E67|nr:GNAT family protein [Sphingomonas phyllosphaerae]
MTPRLATARLVLRARVPDDAEALFAAMGDATAMTWWSHAPAESVAALRERFIARDDGSWRTWAVTHADDDVAIGFVAAGEKRAGVVEIGYLLVPAAQRRGYAREAVGAVIGQLFAEGYRRVFADTDPANVGSNRLLEALGFRREGLLRAEWETHIGVRDTVLWGLLRDEW